jgi:hypothetical protein
MAEPVQAIPIVQAFNVDETMNNMNEAKEAFQKMLKDKNKWGFLFLILVILFVIWLLFLYIREKLNLQVWNNNTMVNSYNVLDGPSIGPIGNNHKFLLRDYYVASSYNSCCGGNIEKDFVDMTPLRTVISQGARLLDFEIYSKNGEPIVAAGPGPNPNGKYCLKGTYNSIPFQKAMNGVSMFAFNGAYSPNATDPLFLSFRIKTNNGNIYPIMANIIKKVFTGRFLGPKYSNNGLYNKSGSDIIANIPLLNLREKVIIIIQDSTGNYKGSPFEEYINISGKGADGNGMPFATIYSNTDIVEAYDPSSVIEQNKKFLGISMPPYSPKDNTPGAIHHKLGVQCVMMKYNLIDAQMLAYRNFFMNRGTAFRLKDDHLRYFDTKIADPKPQKKELSYGPRQIAMLGGAYKPSL